MQSITDMWWGGVVCVFFFFQAEDGIRDWSVTGVQTCALPIYYSDCLSNCTTVVVQSRPTTAVFEENF